MEFKHTDYVQLENGKLVHGETFDGPGALSIKIYFPLMDYVEGEQQDVDSKDSIKIQLDFWSGNGKKEMDGKKWPYTDYEIIQKNIEDISGEEGKAKTTEQILIVLRALRQKLSTSIGYKSLQEDRSRISKQIERQILKFKKPSGSALASAVRTYDKVGNLRTRI